MIGGTIFFLGAEKSAPFTNIFMTEIIRITISRQWEDKKVIRLTRTGSTIWYLCVSSFETMMKRLISRWWSHGLHPCKRLALSQKFDHFSFLV